MRSVTWTWVIVMLAGALGLAAGAGYHYWRQVEARAQQHQQQKVAAARARDEGPGPGDMIGQPAPAFTLPDLDGTRRSLAEFEGKGVVLVNFWATWCPPCLREVPTLVHLDRQFRARGLHIVGVALDDADRVREFATEQGIDYTLLTGSRAAFEIARRFGDRRGTLPYSVVIGPGGRIRATHMGALTPDKATALVRPLLPDAPES